MTATAASLSEADNGEARADDGAPHPDERGIEDNVTVNVANGFLVVSAFRDPTRVVPPYRYSYTYEHYDTLNDALDAYKDLENGEYAGFLPVGLQAAKNGLAFATFDAHRLAQLLKETRRAA